jgi:acyl-CoA thioester hydrolase
VSAPHRLQIRVYYEDTDAAGIVYHANYLRFAERARTEMLRSLGFGQAELRRDHGVLFAIRRCSMDFMAPARLDDLLTVETAPERLGGARVVAVQTVLLDERPLVRIKVELAVLGADDLRPRRLPAEMAGRLGMVAPPG